MNLTIIGATGMVGTRLTAEALNRGHRVTAASRRPQPSERAGVSTSTVDVDTGRNLRATVAGADAVVLTVRAAAGEEDLLAPATTRVLDAAADAGTPLLVIGGAGPLRSPADPGRIVAADPAHVPDAWRSLAEASTAQLHACQAHPTPTWTYLSPPAVLEPGERTGSYRRGTTTLLIGRDGTSRISAEDLAVAALDELENPGTDRHFTVAAP
ncbi:MULTISPECIES: NAD(P)-dependent oxidoreductase [Prauserella salsuginis group]|uniref:NAD(P)-binding domain-containing protein n=2 Tax=Prauserella salsuginis group TaxID=2893672 RepID=A0A839XKE0_9PSEU|nr:MULTISPECIES: NAD(P)H-binding protein [Prauserella salsuginis group]MBB3661984.1 hypothetical protein [Prauserella sediminis]MCR3719683.1 hypothetical protein [Prauserella flava]MCR3736774.1 hypothetical protein [Prauserella salsuginis]